MPELNTPYRIGNTINGNTVNGDMVEVTDCNGFYVLECFKVDADEIIKRINGNFTESAGYQAVSKLKPSNPPGDE